MTTQDTAWIVAAVIAAIIVIVGLALVARKRSNEKRRVEAQSLREEIEVETTKVDKRQALAAETDARARAAEAEAEAKAAEAQRLRERASSHSESVAATREELDERRRHADSLDPDVKSRKHDADEGRDVVSDHPDHPQPPPPPQHHQHEEHQGAEALSTGGGPRWWSSPTLRLSTDRVSTALQPMR
jgi:type IV secretory pathway VirB10-like protein